MPSRADHDRTFDMTARYEQMFASRDLTDWADGSRYHLYHPALYWSRLVGFCRLTPNECASWMDTELGACVAVGSNFVDPLIESNSAAFAPWQRYRRRLQSLFEDRSISLADVEEASKGYDECLAALEYDPWKRDAPS
jgi:hypothetical protein